MHCKRGPTAPTSPNDDPRNPNPNEAKQKARKPRTRVLQQAVQRGQTHTILFPWTHPPSSLKNREQRALHLFVLRLARLPHVAARAIIMAPLPLPSSASATTTSGSQPPPQPQAQQQRHRASDTFALAVTRQAVAQAALAVGCKHTYPSVLDALTDLVRDYIVAVGTEAQAKAESGGRTRVTLLDVLAALEEPQQEAGRDRYELDWRALRGFAFRGDVTQLDRPEAFQWYQPFHTHIPPFPVRSSSSGTGAAANDTRKQALPVEEGGEVNGSAGGGSGAGNGAGAAASGEGEGFRPPYVPSFLPAFPPQHTFRKTGLKASSKTEDPVAIQRHRIATKQLILKAIARQKTASGKGPADCGKAGGDDEEDMEVVAPSSSPSPSVPKRATRGRPLPNEEEEEEDEDLLFSSAAQESRPVATASEVIASEPKQGGSAR